MIFKVEVDTREWKNVGQKLREWKNLDVPEFIRYRARVVCADLIDFTPPRGVAPGSEGHKEQLKIGIHAVDRDIGALWKSANALLPKTKTVNPNAAKWMQRYIRSGNVQAFKTMISKMGMHNEVVLTVTEGMHDRRRSHKTGKALRGGQTTLVLRGNSLKALRRAKIGHVGRWKSGWLASATVLNVRSRDIPPWVKKHGLNGGFIDDTRRAGDNPSFTLINDLEGTQAVKTDEILGAVLRINEAKLNKEFRVLERKFDLKTKV